MTDKEATDLLAELQSHGRPLRPQSVMVWKQLKFPITKNRRIRRKWAKRHKEGDGVWEHQVLIRYDYELPIGDIKIDMKVAGMLPPEEENDAEWAAVLDEPIAETDFSGTEIKLATAIERGEV